MFNLAAAQTKTFISWKLSFRFLGVKMLLEKNACCFSSEMFPCWKKILRQFKLNLNLPGCKKSGPLWRAKLRITLQKMISNLCRKMIAISFARRSCTREAEWDYPLSETILMLRVRNSFRIIISLNETFLVKIPSGRDQGTSGLSGNWYKLTCGSKMRTVLLWKPCCWHQRISWNFFRHQSTFGTRLFLKSKLFLFCKQNPTANCCIRIHGNHEKRIVCINKKSKMMSC